MNQGRAEDSVQRQAVGRVPKAFSEGLPLSTDNAYEALCGCKERYIYGLQVGYSRNVDSDNRFVQARLGIAHVCDYQKKISTSDSVELSWTLHRS